MTDRIAIFSGIILAIALAVDIYFFDFQNVVFLGKRFIDLIEWLAFWR